MCSCGWWYLLACVWLVVSAGVWLVVLAGKFRLVLLPDVHVQILCERFVCTVALKRALPMKAVWLTASSVVVEALQHDACRSKVRKRVVADWRCNRRLLWEPYRKVLLDLRETSSLV